MKVPVKWLREFVDTDLSTREIAHRLTMAGLEAEQITVIGAEWDNVYVGLVERVDPHPDADRLTLPRVVAGENEITVVTGAPNIKAGQKVALALSGAVLVDPYADELKYRTLKPSTLRGVVSEGMVCSEKELGLSGEHEGILVLEDNAPVGAPLVDWLGDEVIEFEITPNLVHSFSVLGIARELGAILDLPVEALALADLTTIPRDDNLVTIEAPRDCGRYTMTLIENTKIEPSPAWLQRRLRAVDLRPVNNYVDISNYVMLEMGHPTHPFDAECLAGDQIIVRHARKGERITTIDHIERELDAETLVIADEEKAVGVAGIMGGVDTEISESTTRILLESAWFDATATRRTTRHLRLNSDASARFGRDIDPNGASLAAARFIQLVKQIDPGAQIKMYADQYLQKRDTRQVSLKYSELERLLGMVIPLDDALAILDRLDLQPTVDADGTVIQTTVPTYRNDIHLSADLIEEVVRIYGYEHLPETMISGSAVSVVREPARLLDRAIQDTLVGAGLTQVQTYTMLNEADLLALSPDNSSIPDILGGYPKPEADFVRARNPLRTDWELMRPSLLPSLLRIASENLKFNDRVAVFETARTYQPEGLDKLPDERRTVCIVMTGSRAAFNIYHPDSPEFDFFDVKGVLVALLKRIGTGAEDFKPVQHPSLHPRRAAALEAQGIQVGILGELHPRVARHFGIDSRTAVAEIDVEAFYATQRDSQLSLKIGRHQPVRQDFAIVVDESVVAREVEDVIRQAAGFIASEVTLFDIYRGDGIADGAKSFAYRVSFSAPDRQPAEHEIERARNRIEKMIAKELGGSLRS